ncbi:MAG: ABC transporter ATP-binding protein [Candidatus Humimicrobiaceae bacterium]
MSSKLRSWDKLAFIEANNVSFGYKESLVIIRDVFLGLDNGVFTGLVGPNGSGKTTIGKLLCGILKPDSGEVFLGEKAVSSLRLPQVGKIIGYLFQNPDTQIFNTVVKKELSFIMELKGMDAGLIGLEVDRMLKLFKLWEFKDSYTFNLSYGEKKRLAIASVLVNNPKYLILDEPTTGLDMQGKKLLSGILKSLLGEGIGMLVISHDRNFIKDNASRILRIEGGKPVG